MCVRACACVRVRACACVCETSYIPKLKEALPTKLGSLAYQGSNNLYGG